MGVINMAHGEFIMAGAYTPYVLQTGLLAGATGVAFVASLPVAILAAGPMGLAPDRLRLVRLRARPLATLLATFGVALLLQQAARDLFGAPNVAVVAPSWLRGNWTLAGVTMPHNRLFIIALVVAVVGAIRVFLSASPQGRRMRAVMQNRDLAAVSG